jgi:nicotinamide riboside kinase
MTRFLVTTGPESSGKTTLATQLSGALAAPLVTEASRDYLTELYRGKRGYHYQQHDLLSIARLQYQREQHALNDRPESVVCDTDLLVIVIWSEVRYGNVEHDLARLFDQALAANERSYLLCTPDMPWEADPLRENPRDREQLFERYRRKLDTLGVTYQVMRGNPDERLRAALYGLSA